MPTREQLEAEARRRGLRPDGRWRDAEGDFAEVPRRADARRQGMRDIAQMPAPVRTMLGAFARDPEEPEYVFDAVVPRPQRSPIERAQILAGNIVEPIGNAYESLSKGIGSAVRDLPRNAIMAGMDANQWAGNEAQKAAQDPGAYADRLAGSAVTGWLNAPKTIGGPMLAQPVDDMIEGDARLKAGLNTGNAAEARSGARQALAGGAFTALNVLPAGAPVSRVARAGEGLPAARMPRQAAQAPGSVAYGDNALSQSVRLPTRDRLDPITQMRLDAEPIQGADDFDPFGRATPRERRFGRTGGTIPQQPEAGTPEWDAAVQAARTKRDGGMQLTRTERDLLRMEGDIQSGGAFSSVEMPGNRPGMPGVGSSSGDRSPSSRGLIKGAIKAGDELGYDRKYTRGLIKFGQEGMKPEATAARAQQQGWVGPVYRGMDSPTGETQFRPTISHAHEGQGVSTTKDPTVASEYSAAANTSPLGGETVYPLMVRGKTIDRDLFDRRVEAIVRDEGVLYKEAAKRAIDQFRAQGYTGIRSPVQSEMRVWPDADGEVRNIRSAYATFDPALKNRKDLMASRPESPKGQVGARPVREAGDPYRPVDLPSSNQPAALGIGEVRRSGPPDAQARTTSPKDIILGYVDRDSLGEIADNSGYAESGLTVLRQRLQKEAAANPAEFAAKYGVDETTARRFVSAEKLSVGERGADTSDRILDAAERLMRTGAKPTPKAISDMTGIPSGTVKVLFSHLRNPEKYGRATNGPRLDRFNALQQAVKDKYGANLWAPVGLGAGAGAMALTSEDAEAQDGYAYPEAYRPLDNNGRFATPDEIGPTQAPDELEDQESGDNPWRPLVTAGAIGIGALGGRAVGGMLGRSRALRRRDFNPDMLRRFDVYGSAIGAGLFGAGSEAALDGNPAIGGVAGLGAGYLFGRGADMLGDMRVPGLGSADRNAKAMQYADELGQLSAPRTMRVEDARYSVPGPGGTVQVYPLPDDYLEPLPRDVPNPDYGAQLRERFEYAGPGPRTWGLGETGSGASGGRPRSLTEREALMQQDPSITDQRLERRLLLGQRFSTPSEEARRGLSSAPAAFERMPDALTMTGDEAKRLARPQDPILPPPPPGDVTPPPEPRPTPQVTYAPMDPVPPLRARTGFEGMTPAVTSDVRPPKGPNRMRMEERKSDAARDRYLAAKGKSGAGFSDDELAEAASVVGADVVTGKNGGVNRAATARAIRERLAAPGDKTLYARLRRAFPDKSLALLLSAGAGAGAVSQQEDAFAPVR